jgi:hypothetical protein
MVAELKSSIVGLLRRGNINQAGLPRNIGLCVNVQAQKKSKQKGKQYAPPSASNKLNHPPDD